MRLALPAAAVLLLIAGPGLAEAPLEQGLSGAFRGCEEWILNPSSWVNGAAPFVTKVGLGDHMGQVARVDGSSLPPPQLRAGAHYWRINSTPGAGYVLVVSDQLPMCHITGGGDADLQPVTEAVLGADGFTRRWATVSERTSGDMKTTVYRNRAEPALSLLVSRAAAPGQRLDRVQVIATGTISPAK
jgi:hypothetical protein